jgi:hypothetical protein
MVAAPATRPTGRAQGLPVSAPQGAGEQQEGADRDEDAPAGRGSTHDE